MGKYIVILMVIIGTNLSGQTFYGTNGSNFTDAINSETLQYIDELIPAGETFVLRLRQDKDKINISNVLWMDEYLSDRNKHLKLVYTIEPKKTIEDNFAEYELLKDLEIIAIEIDNEAYADSAGYGGSWATFKSFFEDDVAYIKSIGFRGKIIFPVAPRPKNSLIAGGNSRHQKYNDPAIPYINSDPQYEPVFHYYEGASDAKIIAKYGHNNIPQGRGSGLNEEKEDFFKQLNNQLMASTTWENTFSYFTEKFPTKRMWITETGVEVNTSNLDNTISTGMAFFNFLNKTRYNDKIAVILKHNGMPTTTGIIGNRNRLDLPGGEYKKRVGYYVLQMFLANKDLQPFYGTTDQNSIFLSGQYYYSSAGYCEWWDAETTPSYEVYPKKGIPDGISFGYITETEPECRDSILTVGLKDVITGYTTTYITSIDSILKPLAICEKCRDRWFKLRHKATCADAIQSGCVTKTYVYTIDTVIVPVYTQIPIFDTVIVCQEPEDSIPGEMQAQFADTLIFHNETEFRDFLNYYDLWPYYEIEPQFVDWDCKVIPDYLEYDKEVNDDYLNERLTKYLDGFPHVIADHEYLRKVINLFIPMMKEAHPGQPVNFCDIDLYITNPRTGQVAVFYNHYLWPDESGRYLFNYNKKLYMLWGYNSATVSFPVTITHRSTGLDYTFSEFADHKEITIRFNGIEGAYPRR